ncbi:hypothetical protein Tco_1484435 [Tanacetum coccineum]
MIYVESTNTLRSQYLKVEPPLHREMNLCVPWASWFLRFLDNKREKGELMRHSIDNGPYIRKEIDWNNNVRELSAAMIHDAMLYNLLIDQRSDVEPTYDAELISKLNASQINMINGLLSKSNHEHHHHEKLKTIIHTSVDDQIDSDIIFDDPYVDNNSG